MYGVDAFFLGQRHDTGNIEISFDGPFASADLIRLVRLKTVQRQPILLRIDGHGAQAEFVGGAKYADGDFAAVGGEQLLDRLQLCWSWTHSWRAQLSRARAMRESYIVSRKERETSPI